MAVDVMSKETCLLTLDYAYYHVLFCLAQVILLYVSGHTKYFRLAHSFGLFALVADYAVNFMTTGTRTLSYPNLAPNLDNGWLSGDEALGPVGEFFFFLWFDYSAFGLLIWAKSFEDHVRAAQTSDWKTAFHAVMSSPMKILALAIVPLQFWSAPLLASSLQLDSRTLLLSRTSSKDMYVVMLLVFPIILRYMASMSWHQVAAIWLSGVGCGLIHHAPLCLFGMRGYTDTASLFITLGTEWPAIILGVAVVEELGGLALSFVGNACVPYLAKGSIVGVSVDNENDFSADGYAKDDVLSPTAFSTRKEKTQQRVVSVRGTSMFASAMLLTLFLLMGPHLANIDDKDAMAYLIPLIPGKHMQSVGTAFMRLRTCELPKHMPRFLQQEPLDCWAGRDDGTGNAGNDLLVMASAAKSGAVLSARLVVEIGLSCGLCVASGERSAAGIPGPVEELPVYPGKLLHAILNMRTWPDYASRHGYNISSLLTLPPSPSPAKSLRFFPPPTGNSNSSSHVRCVTLVRDPFARLRSLYTYARSGGEHWFRYESGLMRRLNDPSLTLPQSLDLFWNTFGKGYLIQSHEYMMMNINLGCTPIQMESFRANFSEPVVAILRAYGISEETIPIILERVSTSDLSTKSEAQRKSDAHVSANKFSKQLVAEVKTVLLQQMPEVAEMVSQHRKELGY